MKQQVILIVDDEPMWLKLLSRFFSDNGYKVLTATTGAGALETLEANRPDLAVLDFNLSDGDALPVCAAIRKLKGRRTPIVIFSSDPSAEACVGIKRGADRFLLKTSPLETLLTTVAELLSVRA